jgi:triphosphoribosyl-dephospho-CoA synthase
LKQLSTYTKVSNCATLAALLEVSAYPKPGNIHRLNDFPETSYEHFLAGGVALGTAMGNIAKRASQAENVSEIKIGQGILDAVKAVDEWQSGGNTHLGVILLNAPLSAGAGLWIKTGSNKISKLREYTRKAVKAATPEDSILIYEAIDKSMSKENLGSTEKLDVKNDDSKKQILGENITPLEVFRLCSERDQICREWITGFDTVFELGYPYLRDRLQEGYSIKEATVDTFLSILSEHNDSLIKRKKGNEAARKVSIEAKKVLDAGGIRSDEGNKRLWELDKELNKQNGALNPGTTADLTAASLFVLLLSGWRP